MDGEIGQEGQGGEESYGMHLFGSVLVGGLEELEVDYRDVRRRRRIS